MKILHVGWCNKDNSDKVYAIIELQVVKKLHNDMPYHDTINFVRIWGPRGKSLRHKIDTMKRHEIESLFSSKVKRNYKVINESELNDLYPEFEEDLKDIGIWARLSC